MKKWMSLALDLIQNEAGLMSMKDIEGMVARGIAGADMPIEPPTERTIHRWIGILVGADDDTKKRRPAPLLRKIQRDLYQSIRFSPNAAAVAIRPSAIVSAQTVLSEMGAFNNSSRIVYAVIDSDSADGKRPHSVNRPDPNDPPEKVARQGSVEFEFIGMKREIYLAGDAEDRLDADFPYPRATPERALCDWLYIAGSGAHAGKKFPPGDLELEDLDEDRVRRLAEAMGVTGHLERWMTGHGKSFGDSDFEDRTAGRLGL